MSSEVEKPEAIILSHQRSGTHFLQASLASHPRIHVKDECLMHYRRRLAGEAGERSAALITYDTLNRKGFMNLAIVMYSQMDLLGRYWGSLNDFKVIHLTRCAEDVARSFAQMRADKSELGQRYRPHYLISERPHEPTRIDPEIIGPFAAEIRSLQQRFRRELANHHACLEITYEQMTDGVQTNVLRPDVSRLLLSFLRLEYCELTNALRKTGGHSVSRAATGIADASVAIVASGKRVSRGPIWGSGLA